MAQPYIGEIRMFGGSFDPLGWALCNGQLLPISENETLFTLIGTIYGGDGQETFALPDLRGRTPIHQGNGYSIGETGGVESVTLSVNQIPIHNHPPQVSRAATSSNPNGKVWADWPDTPYSEATTIVPMAAGAIAATGGNQPHDNMPPYLAVSFIISLYGLYPSAT